MSTEQQSAKARFVCAPDQNRHATQTMGAFHLSELTGRTSPVITRILLLSKTIQPDQSNPKYYARRIWFLTNGKRPKIKAEKLLITSDPGIS